MTTAVLGIDVSKAKFDVALLIDKKFKFKKFNNSLSGFQGLSAWLTKHKVSDLHACMEATGSYGEELATYLFDAGIKVSVVNPARIKGFAQCELSRSKTDKTDAMLIARFCLAMRPNFWEPKALHIRQLQRWVRRVDSLKRMKQKECNRKDCVNDEEIIKAINQVVTFLDEQIIDAKAQIERIIVAHNDLQSKRTLLESIPGIGDATVALVLAFIGDPNDFNSAKEVSAFLGLNPRQHQSGSSVNGRTRISKTGDATLRKALYMPALTAMRYNPTISLFSENLLSRGKAKMAVVVAVMRKLVHIAYGVLKSGKPFDPAYENKKLCVN